MGQHRWALLLDVDGCLLDFADDPARVEVPQALRHTLSRLHAGLDGALALVSGRRIDDLDRLFGHPGWAMAGLHGLQLRGPDGHRDDVAVDPAQTRRMRLLAGELAQRLDLPLEDKGIAVALHCRTRPERQAELEREAGRLAAQLQGYELQRGDRVVEFKPAGVDKGSAVQALLARPPFAARRPVYLGDDLTDEHAFAAVNRCGGLSVRVGRRTPSQAAFTLPDPRAVHDWLGAVLEACAVSPTQLKESR